MQGDFEIISGNSGVDTGQEESEWETGWDGGGGTSMSERDPTQSEMETEA